MQFLARALNQQRYPAYYRDMAAVNIAGPKLLGLDPSPPTKLSAAAVAALMDQGAAVVDVRQGRDYDKGHIPGSYSVGLDGPLSAWVGWLVPRDRTIVLAGGTDAQPSVSSIALASIPSQARWTVAWTLGTSMAASSPRSRPSTSRTWRRGF